MDLFKAVIADCIGNDIHVCLKNNAPTGAVILTYCAMDNKDNKGDGSL